MTRSPRPVSGRFRAALTRPAAVAGALLVASVVPVPDGGAGGGLLAALGGTTGLHLLGYAALALSLAVRSRRLDAVGSGVGGPRLLAAAALATAVGLGIEVVQAGLPWRSFALADAAVNAVGSGVGAAGALVRDRLRGGGGGRDAAGGRRGGDG